jgi:hypothetical protein
MEKSNNEILELEETLFQCLKIIRSKEEPTDEDMILINSLIFYITKVGAPNGEATKDPDN